MPYVKQPREATTLKIESGVPLPGRLYSRWRALAEQMKVGDSVHFDDEREAKRCTSALSKGAKNGARYVMRKMPDGWRVWRTH